GSLAIAESHGTMANHLYRWVLLVLLMGSGVIAQADTTSDPVCLAICAGHLSQVQQVMQSVLRDQPSNAEAHYLEAELLAQQGQLGKAREELSIADRLAPGLPFASQESVQSLRRNLGVSTTSFPSGAIVPGLKGAMTRLRPLSRSW